MSASSERKVWCRIFIRRRHGCWKVGRLIKHGTEGVDRSCYKIVISQCTYPICKSTKVVDRGLKRSLKKYHLHSNARDSWNDDDRLVDDENFHHTTAGLRFKKKPQRIVGVWNNISFGNLYQYWKFLPNYFSCFYLPHQLWSIVVKKCIVHNQHTSLYS